MLAPALRPAIAFVTVNDEISIMAAVRLVISYLFVINHFVSGVVNQKRQPRQWLEKGNFKSTVGSQNAVGILAELTKVNKYSNH